MSDLEKNWDDLPIGPAPIDAILHEAHRVDMRNEMRAELRAEAEATAAAAAAARRRRRKVVGRPLVAAAAVTGVAATLAVGANLGGGGGGGGVGDVHPAAFQADLKPARSCNDLLSTYVARGLKLVSAYGWGGPQIYNGPMEGRDTLLNQYGSAALRSPSDQAAGLGKLTELNGTVDSIGHAPYATADTPETRAQGSSKTGTNVQEAGVDEPDTVKTDGRILAQIHDDELWLYDVAGDAVKRLSSMPIDGVDNPEMLLSGHTIVVIGGSSDDTNVPFTRVLTLDVSDPTSPKQTDSVTYGGGLLSARQHGDAIRLVLSTGLPSLHFTEPHGSVTEQDALAANKKVVRDSTIKDWLPTIAANGGDQKQLLNCTDVAVPDDKVGLDTVAIAGFTADDPTKVDAIGLAGATDLAYESTDHLYLVASPTYGGGPICVDYCGGGIADYKRPYVSPNDGTSYVFDFALNGENAIHVASGEVEGQIRDRWSMDEAGGVLRVAVGPTAQTGNFNSIITLRKRGEELLEAGRIDGIGRGEEIKSARWFDGLAILTTYRERDPMFAVDLTDVDHPKLLGELKLPGYSSYLHPLGKHRIIGVGTGPGGNTQVGLFDTTDLAHLKRLDEAHFRATDPLAATDPRAFTWMQSQRTAYTVIQHWGVSRVGYLATLELRNGRFVTHLQQVEYGDDVDQVRAVPVSADKVALTTGQDARFLPPLPRD